MIEIENNTMRVRFTDFSPANYELFLKCKRLPEYQIETDPVTGIACGITSSARFAQLLGLEHAAVESDALPLPEFLFEHQAEILKLALDAKRYAVWSDCGTGKTLIELEYARQVAAITGGRVLIITLNEIVDQTVEEARQFYGAGLPVVKLDSRDEMRRWCAEGIGQIAITNYEKMNPDEQGQDVVEFRHLSGLILDESSRHSSRKSGQASRWLNAGPRRRSLDTRAFPPASKPLTLQ